MSIFIAVLLHKNVIASCPFVEKLDLHPKDVWQYNADSFWKKSDKFKELKVLEEQAAILEKMRVEHEIREREEREMERSILFFHPLSLSLSSLLSSLLLSSLSSSLSSLSSSSSSSSSSLLLLENWKKNEYNKNEKKQRKND
jgi:hypothetical protein